MEPDKLLADGRQYLKRQGIQVETDFPPNQLYAVLTAYLNLPHSDDWFQLNQYHHLAITPDHFPSPPTAKLPDSEHILKPGEYITIT